MQLADLTIQDVDPVFITTSYCFLPLYHDFMQKDIKLYRKTKRHVDLDERAFTEEDHERHLYNHADFDLIL